MSKREIISLAKGAHKDNSDQMCLLEAVAYLANEPHSDKPQCVCPVLAAFGRRLNDRLNDTDRQQLLPYVERLINTKATKDVESNRGRIFAWAAITNFAPFVLEQKGFIKEAQSLRETPDQDFKEGKKRARAVADAAAAYAADAAAYAVAYAADAAAYAVAYAADAAAYAAAYAADAAAYAAAYAAYYAADAAAATYAAATYAADAAYLSNLNLPAILAVFDQAIAIKE